MTNEEHISEIKAKITEARELINRRDFDTANLEAQIKSNNALNKLDERIIKLHENALDMLEALQRKEAAI